MKHDCTTCEFRFPPQGGSKDWICAHTYYGEEISELMKTPELFPCDGWSASFAERNKQRRNSHLIPSIGGMDCPANGDHGTECECNTCDYAKICYPPDDPFALSAIENPDK